MTTIEGLKNFVPMIVQWKLQSEDDIYDSFDDWEVHTFLCVMKNGEKVKATGIADASYSGEVNKNIYIEDGGNVEDILYWLEIPTPPGLNKIADYKKDRIADYIKSSRKEFMDELRNPLKFDNTTILEESDKIMKCLDNFLKP